MKRYGVVQSGPCAGQIYLVIKKSCWPRWWKVKLDTGSEQAEREIREEYLEP